MTRSLSHDDIQSLIDNGNTLRSDRFEILNPAWLAGFIDGEGTISFTTSSNSGYKLPRISLTSTNSETLVSIKEIYRGSVSEYKHGNERAKRAWKWQLSGTIRIKNLLTDIRPFLRLKHLQADLVLEFLDLVSLNIVFRKWTIDDESWRERERIIGEVAILNRRGLQQ